VSDRIAVIGAGVIGILVARKLQRDGREVLLFDPELPATQCSFGNAGCIAVEDAMPHANPETLRQVPHMLVNQLAPLSVRWRDIVHLLPWFLRFTFACRPSQVEKGTKALAALMIRAKGAWLDEIEYSGLGRFLQEKGIVWIYESSRSYHAEADGRKAMRDFGIDYQDMPAAEACAMVPGLRSDIYGAIFVPGSISVSDPHRLSRAIFDAFVEDGGEFRQQPVSVITEVGGTVLSVSTPEGETAVSGAVIAAGQASRRLTADLGIKAPIVAERGYHVMIKGADARFEMPVGSVDRSVILTPMLDGLRVAGTVEFARRGRPETWERADEVLTHARALFPDLGGEKSSQWMGERPTLPDYLPVIGRATNTENLYLAFGHQHIGLTLAALTGEIIAALVAGRDAGIDMAPLSAARFR
jgi:D-amino-acid dehydrogenase